jgi:hypothetical protein
MKQRRNSRNLYAYRYKVYDEYRNKLIGRANTPKQVSSIIRKYVKSALDKQGIFDEKCAKTMVKEEWMEWLNYLQEDGLPIEFRVLDTTIQP